MKLSIVTTLYYSAPYIVEFCRRAASAAKEVAGDDYEIVIVNDGSPDNACQLAIELAQNDPHLVVVDLSRNFGHHRAMMTGLRHASGDYIFTIDIDLEEEPELLPKFWQTMLDTGADCVYGQQISRKGGFFERWSGYGYYAFLNMISDVKVPENALMAKLMTRQFVSAMLEYRERSLFLGGIMAMTGFLQIPYACKKGSKGTTTYTLSRKLNQAIDSVTSFCSRPLYYIFLFGIAISFISFSGMAWLFIKKLLYDNIFAGWTSLMLTLCLGFGLVISILGIIGLYLAKIFDEVKQRPYATIRQIYTSRQAETK